MKICEHNRLFDKCTATHKEDYQKLLERCFKKGYITEESYTSEKEKPSGKLS